MQCVFFIHLLNKITVTLKTNIMSNTVTYQGETLESLTSQLEYINEALSWVGLENWERKEYESVKEELEFKINSINERMETLKNYLIKRYNN